MSQDESYKQSGLFVTYEANGADFSGLSVLVASDGLLDHTRWLLRLLVGGLLLVVLAPLLDVPQTTLVEHATARQPHDAR